MTTTTLTAEQSILAAMEPGVWYAVPHKLYTLAGLDWHEHAGLLTDMCERGLLIHGNGSTTHGFRLR